MTADTAKITYTITGKRADGSAISLTKDQTFSISEQGVQGEPGSSGLNARVVKLTAANYVITYDAEENLVSPSTIALTATPQNFTVPRYRFTIDGVEGSWQSTATETFTSPSLYFTEATIIKVDVAEGASSTTVLASDSIAIAAIKPGLAGTNGEPGAPGTNGEPGADAYTVILTNEAHTFTADSTGTIATGDYAGSGTSIIVYKGTTELNGILSGTPTTGQFRVTTSATNITVDPTPTSSGNPIIYGDHSAMNADIALITYTVNVENLATFTKTQSFSKSIQGNEGDKGDTGDKGDKGDTGDKGDKGDKGDTGDTGPQGAGIIYRGEYDSTGSTTYFAETNRRDVVKFSNNTANPY
jgi:hypothetical protein